jgi:hypothetical protein
MRTTSPSRVAWWARACSGVKATSFRRGVAVGVGHQFHQQHALKEVVGLGHPYAGIGQPVQRVDLGALPGRLLRLAAKARALGHGARLA